MSLPTDSKERKAIPIYTGFINYFPNAIVEVAKVSYKGNQQHHPNSPMHWDKSKSTDELDALMRHLIEGDWAAVAWRAMANLQRECDKEARDCPGNWYGKLRPATCTKCGCDTYYYDCAACVCDVHQRMTYECS